MAAAHITPACSLSTSHRSCSCAAIVLRGGDTVRFALKTSRSCKKAARWRQVGSCGARLEFRGSSAEEDATTLMEMTALVDDLLELNAVVNEANGGIGGDVRNRVDVLYNRATLLKYSADTMVAAGGRVPVQLTATLKGLQREHASVKNIVRLAMEAGPVISGMITDVEEPPSKASSFSKSVSIAKSLESEVMFKEKEASQASLFESLTLQSSLKAVEGYAMSAPAANDSSPLAAFRREIERRAMEQLAAEKKPATDLEGLGKGDGNSHVLEAIPNEADPRGADAEAQLQVLQDQSSLTDFQQQSNIVIHSQELEKARSELSALEQQLAVAKEGSARAAKAETQLQQLTEEMAATVPLDVHEQVVKLERQSLIMARKKVAQVTAELREKEVILGAVKQEMAAEQDRLLGKVRMLSGELSMRVSAEEVQAAVTNAVLELDAELRKALQRAESMKLELETNDKLLKQLQRESDVERTGLREELAGVKEQLTEMQLQQTGDRAQFLEAAEKVNELEASVTRLRQSMVEAEKERINREKLVLANVKSLLTDMVKTKRESDLCVLKPVGTTDSEEASAEEELECMLSDEKAVALETFFNIMGALMQQDSVKLERMSHRLSTSTNLRKLDGASKVDVDTKPTITLYYESSWEFAYFHYSADSSGWTELPGVCMRNYNNMALKVIDIEGSSVEFVLTDGRGSWDCAPIGGNYHINRSGTFLLSSGFIEQKQ